MSIGDDIKGLEGFEYPYPPKSSLDEGHAMIEILSRSLLIACHSISCGYLGKTDGGYVFLYNKDYQGPPISLAMPVRSEPYVFDRFPPFFDGLLPEGGQLEALLRQNKIDSHDYLTQLEAVGGDLVGAVTVISDPVTLSAGKKDL